MCGRFSLYFFPDAEVEFEERFGIPFPTSDYPASYHIPPETSVAVVNADSDNQNQVVSMFWGLIPSFAQEFKPHPKYKMSNTRAEVFHAIKDNFRKELLVTSRCIVPANNYFEWTRVDKVPFKIEAVDSHLLALGGIYSVWANRDGEKRHSCSIITVPANESLSEIHHRMPFILDAESEKVWLDNQVSDYHVLRNRIEPFPDDGLRYARVSRRVNNVMNNDPELVKPVAQTSGGTQGSMF